MHRRNELDLPEYEIVYRGVKKKKFIPLRRPTPAKLGVETGSSEGDPTGSDYFVATIWIVGASFLALILAVGIMIWVAG